jgi:hypothetical protein
LAVYRPLFCERFSIHIDLKPSNGGPGDYWFGQSNHILLFLVVVCLLGVGAVMKERLFVSHFLVSRIHLGF